MPAPPRGWASGAAPVRPARCERGSRWEGCLWREGRGAGSVCRRPAGTALPQTHIQRGGASLGSPETRLAVTLPPGMGRLLPVDNSGALTPRRGLGRLGGAPGPGGCRQRRGAGGVRAASRQRPSLEVSAGLCEGPYGRAGGWGRASPHSRPRLGSRQGTPWKRLTRDLWKSAWEKETAQCAESPVGGQRTLSHLHYRQGENVRTWFVAQKRLKVKNKSFPHALTP